MASESLLSLDEIISAVSGRLYEKDVCKKNVFYFNNVATDSRKVCENTLFVPLIGEKQDGHKYILQSVEKGASVVFASEKSFLALPENERNASAEKAYVIFVDNTLTALQKAAEKYVSKFENLIKIGITGSNGKTTTKEIAVSVFSKKYNVVATEGNFNSETGLPLSVFRIRKEHEVGIFEMGMNRVNEIGEIASVLKPDLALITNIGTAHIGILGSKQNIAAEKQKIFSYFSDNGVGFVPEDDEFADFLCAVKKGTVKRFGLKNQDYITNVSSAGITGTEFEFFGKHVKFNLPGEYNFKNMLGVTALALEAGVGKEEIAAGIEAVKPVYGRSCIKEGKFSIVEDFYNANAESMAESVKFYGKTGISGKKTFILGDMLELGDESKAIHERIGLLACNSGASVIAFVGTEMIYAYEAAKKLCDEKKLNLILYSLSETSDESVSAFAEELAAGIENGDLVLIKGSRGMKLERFCPALYKKAEVQNEN